MPRRRFIDRLPDDLRRELYRKIREYDYNTTEDLLSWLKQENKTAHNVSRSSLARYCRDQRITVKTLMEARKRPDPDGMLTDDILRELGSISFEEAQLKARRLAIEGVLAKRLGLQAPGMEDNP